MATLDITSKYVSWTTDQDRISPYWDQNPTGHKKSDPNIDYKYRKTSPKLKTTTPDNWFHRAEFRCAQEQHVPQQIYAQRYAEPSTPQFSGTIVPSGIREGFICVLDTEGRSKRRTVLEKVHIDASGYFESRGWYPVRPNGEYVLFVEGDDTYESNDFRLNSPVANEWRYGLDPNLTAVHNSYDSAANLRQLLVHDQFTGSQGASLNGRAPDTVAPGNWVASGVNIGAHAGGGGNFVAYTLGSGSTAVIDSGSSDVLMHMDVVFGDSAIQNTQVGFILRWFNNLNFSAVLVSLAATAAPQLSYVRYVGGTPTTVNFRILPYIAPLVVDQYYQWKLLAQGDVIWYQFSDGAKVWSDRVIRETTYQNNTLHGFLISSQQYVDNFKIWNA